MRIYLSPNLECIGVSVIVKLCFTIVRLEFVLLHFHGLVVGGGLLKVAYGIRAVARQLF